MKLFKILLPVFFLIIIFALFIVKTNFLGVKDVGVRFIGASCAPEQDIKNEVSLVGQNILFLSKKKITGQIINKYPCVKTVLLERHFSNKVTLTLTSRTALARLSSYQQVVLPDLMQLDASSSSVAALVDWSFPKIPQDKFLIIDDEGFVFKESSENNLPLIFLPTNYQIGQKITSGLAPKLADLEEKLKLLKDQGSVESYENFFVKLQDDYLLIDIHPKILFSLEKDFSKELASLQLILQKAKIDGKVIQTLDLRFDKPVIVFTNEKK